MAAKLRILLLQALVLGAIIGLGLYVIHNTLDNLARRGVATGFSYLGRPASFDIGETLIAYSPADSYGRALLVGLLNTLEIAVLGCVLATLLGLVIGIARLSRNWLVSRLAGGYVELIRNIPLLLQILFLYNVVLKSLPEMRGSVALPFGGILNKRGLFLPRPIFAPDFGAVVLAFAIGIIVAIGIYVWARRRQERTGEQIRVFWMVLAAIFGLPLLVFIVAGRPLSFGIPDMGRFNVRGGLEILPEFAALLLALSLYTAAFIAEVVRAGVLAVSAGQTEAAQALGLRSGTTLRLVVVPQAMRVIVPPLASQYLNLIKNSSLAVAIGYPDLFQVFAGTVLNITGQAVEVIAITMAVYLSISLVTSLLMNLYGRTTAIVER
jgi:general L-amino acid transport system permease protein